MAFEKTSGIQGVYKKNDLQKGIKGVRGNEDVKPTEQTSQQPPKDLKSSVICPNPNKPNNNDNNK